MSHPQWYSLVIRRLTNVLYLEATTEIKYVFVFRKTSINHTSLITKIPHFSVGVGSSTQHQNCFSLMSQQNLLFVIISIFCVMMLSWDREAQTGDSSPLHSLRPPESGLFWEADCFHCFGRSCRRPHIPAPAMAMSRQLICQDKGNWKLMRLENNHNPCW